MEGIHSYEQRSTSEIGHEFDFKQNRVIIVNRHDPQGTWNTANGPLETKWFAWCSWLRWRLTPSNWHLPGRQPASSRLSHPSSLSTSKNVSLSLDGAHKTSDLHKLGSISSTSTLSPTRFHAGPFPSNEWRTSKYTLINFLPKNMFEQFRRMANFYFLSTAILQCVLPFSPVGPTTSLLPLLFVVSTTAIKQAYEDYLRHKLDDEVNNRSCHVLRNKKLIKIRSKDIRVGDFVYVRNNEEIPCDMILIASSSSPGHDRCYITTANLDGETSLKSRSCFTIKEQIGNIEQLDDTLLVVECEKPNATLYEFNGYLRAPKSKESYEFLVESLTSNAHQNSNHRSSQLNNFDSFQRDPTVVHALMRKIRRMRHTATATATIGKKSKAKTKTKTKSRSTTPEGLKKVKKDQSIVTQAVPEFHEIPLDISNLLLRASRLRNTSFIYGLVVYTGRDTKLAHNSQVKANKFSSTESKVNIFLLLSFLILMFFSIVAAIRYHRPNYWFYQGLERSDSFEQILVAHFLLYNYLVPISLYVTLEFVKFFGTMSVVDDKKMKTTVWESVTSETKTSTRNNLKPDDSVISFSSIKKVRVLEGPKCNSSDLNEELGQVEVLFSDKTGTLTENKMKFTACSAFGQLYRAINQQLYLQPTALYKAPIPDVVQKLAKVPIGRASFLTPAITTSDQSHEPAHRSVVTQTTQRPFDHRIIPPISKLKLVDEMLSSHEEIVEFFVCLCLCSTITLNETLDLESCLPGKTGNEYDFQSASPDEESLISAAHLYGITMCKSNDRECFIVIQRPSDGHEIAKPRTGNFKAIVETKHSTEHYIVRHFEREIVLEFNSIRKRMSVIYKDLDNDCMLMVSKGSEEMLDCVNLTNIDQNQVHRVNTTLAHFEAFAKSGLRTLLVAKRLVQHEEYKFLMDEMKEARLSMSNRDHLLGRVYQKAECNLELIGTTAVEDTLQEGVPETIENLKEAGIKVWLLTGDKVETAISVAYLCKLLDREMLLLHLVRQQDVQACQRLLTKFNEQLKLSKDDLATREHVSIKSAKSAMQKSPSHSKQKNSFPITSRTRFALIADGRSLHYAMKYAKEELAKLCKQCTCVLGCRLSPLQKSEIVDMIKQSDGKPITAAIGDGANDVSMIQEAHVGIGICGKEGRQAVNSSDFAINRFHMLNRLLFVHGHLFYHRTANTIHYFFYKNILFVLPQFIYSFYNLSSALSLYHPFLLIGYNLFFTSLPILIYGLYEKHIPENLLENYPQLYKLNRHSSQLTLPVFISWLFLGAVQALIGFYVLYIVWGSHTPFLESGKMAGINGFSIILYFCLIMTATFRLYFLSKYHSLYLNLSMILSYVLLPVFFYAYSVVDW